MKNQLHLLLTCTVLLLILSSVSTYAQVAINHTGDTPDSSAMLDIESTTRGILIPRMSTTQRLAINDPAEGLMVYDTISKSFWYYSDAWLEISDDQQISRDGLTVTLENGGSFQDSVLSDDDLINFIYSNDVMIWGDFSHYLNPSSGILTLGSSQTDVDLSPLLDNTDDQQLSRNEDTIFLEDGGYVLDSVLTETDVDAMVADNGYLTSEVDGSTTNEIQDLDLTNNTLSIESGNSVDLSTYLDNTDDQQLSRNGDTIFLEDGGYVLDSVLSDDYLADYLGEEDYMNWGDYTPYFNSSSGTLNLGQLNNLDLSSLQDQQLSRNEDTIFLEDGGYVLDSVLTETDVDAMVANNGYLTSEVDGSTTNEIQDLDLTNNTLSIENGNSVDLSSYLDNTDDQQISRDGLTVTLENGGSFQDSVLSDVDVVEIMYSNDVMVWGDFTSTLNPSSGNLLLGGQTTVDLSALLDNTDDQQLSRNEDTLFLEDGGYVLDSTLTETDVDAMVANNGYLTSQTDDQTISRDGLTVTLENGGTFQDSILTETDVDAMVADNGYLTSEVDGSTTNEIQDLDLINNTLSIENGNSVDLSTYLDNTDDQQLSRNEDTLFLEDGGYVLDSILTETDVDAMVADNGYLTSEVDGSTTNEIQDLDLTNNTLSIENGNSVDLSSYLDNTDDQQLSRNEDTIFLEDGGYVLDSTLTETDVDAMVANNGYLTSQTDDQTISRDGLTVTLENGGTFQDSILTETDVDAMVADNGYLTSEVDGSTTNEIQDLDLINNTLSIENGNSVDLSSYLDNTDDQQISREGLTVTLEDGGTFQDSILTETDVDAMVADNGYLTSGSLTIITDENDNLYSNNSIGDLENFTGIDNLTLGFDAGSKFIENSNTIAIGNYSLANATDGNRNIAIGFSALSLLDTGSANIAIGESALLRLTTEGDVASSNTALGYGAGQRLIYGDNNVYLGAQAGPEFSSGLDESNKLYINSASSESNTPLIGGDFDQDRVGINIHIDSMTTGATLQVGGDLSLRKGEDVNEFSSDETFADSSNTAIPTEAAVKSYVDNKGFLTSDSLTITLDENNNVYSKNSINDLESFTGLNNVVLGFFAGSALEDGSSNLFMGAFTAGVLNNGNQNTAIGLQALGVLDSGENNTAIGASSLSKLKALDLDLLGSSNTALGHEAGINLVYGQSNLYLGTGAGPESSSGLEESFKLYINDAASNTPLIGGDFDKGRVGINMHIDSLTTGATLQVDGDLSLRKGEDVNEFSSDETFADSSNTAIPTEAAVKGYVDNNQNINLDENNNVYSKNSIDDLENFIGIENVVLGFAGNSISSANNNVLLGHGAAYSLSDGDQNIALGNQALTSLDTGDFNLAIGASSLLSIKRNDLDMNPFYNSGFGYGTGFNVSYGRENLYLGTFAGPSGSNIEESYKLYINSSTTSTGSNTPLIGGDFEENRVGINMHIDSMLTGATLQVGGDLSLQNGEDVDEFSSDETFADSSNTAIPTEAAVKGYVDNKGFLTGDSLSIFSDNKMNLVSNQSLLDRINGSSNIAFGDGAGDSIKYGEFNIAIGEGAAASTTDGDDNIAFGQGAVNSMTTGSNNIGIGTQSISASNYGYSNIAVGTNSLSIMSTDNDGNPPTSNIALGTNAGDKLKEGSYNLYLGNHAGPAYEFGDIVESYKLYINSGAGTASNTPLIGGDFDQDRVGINIHIDSMTTGATLQVGGDLSLLNGEDVNEFSSDETFADSSHTAIPTEAAVKYYVDNSITNAYQTISLVEDTLFISGGDNTDFEADLSSLVRLATSGNTNVHGGTSNFSSLDADNATGNTAIGRSALNDLQQGNHNSAFGRYSLLRLENANYNTSIGSSALREATDADNQTAMGFSALREHKYGSDNMAIGYEALRRATGGSYNVALGSEAMAFADSGSYNIALGYESLNSINGADSNIAIGSQALSNLLSGNTNIAIGAKAGQSYTGKGSVFLGHYAGQTETSTDSVLYIANSNTSTPLIGGDFANGKVGIGRTIVEITGQSEALQVNGDAAKNTPGDWAGNSDKRLKTNITYMNADQILQQVLNMKGVTYQWNDTVTGYSRPEGTQYGFIAQDLQKVWPSKISEDGLGYLKTAYGDYDPMFVEAIKALNQKLEEAESINSTQKQQIEKLEAQNKELQLRSQLQDSEQDDKMQVLLKRMEKLEKLLQNASTENKNLSVSK